jgi:hypothetical protein
LYVARDVIPAPIAVEWAYTSAPPGEFMPLGAYECRFRLEGTLVSTVPFTIEP